MIFAKYGKPEIAPKKAQYPQGTTALWIHPLRVTRAVHTALFTGRGEETTKLLCLCSKERIDDPEKVITLNSEAYKTRKGEERLKSLLKGLLRGGKSHPMI